MATTIESIQQLYIAYFNRPADLGGLNYWAERVANGTSLSAISAEFSTQAEFTAEYGGKSPEATVAQVYQNLLNRTPDATGLAFWATGLRNGVYTTKSIVEEIAKSALQNQNPEGNVDRATVDNKIDAAIAFTDYLKTDVAAQIAYSTGSANGVAKTFIAGVTDAASLAAAIAGLSTVANNVVGAGNPGTTNTLTTGVDTLPGGAGNDVFNGLVEAAGATSKATITALDSIDGGAGSDTLNINVLDATAVPTTLTVKNVENVVVRGATDVDVNTSSWTGVTSLKVTQAEAVIAKAAGTTAVDISGATDDIAVDGGSSVAVSVKGGAGVDVNIGGTTVAKGAVSVTNTNLNTGIINVDGGTSVTVTAEGVAGTGTINVGQGGAATDLPTGVVSISSTGADAGGAAPVVLSAINVDGGSKVNVVAVATSDAAAAEEDVAATTNTITEGAITINGSKLTTEVSVKQDASYIGANAVAETVGAKTVDTVTFTAITAGSTVTVGGLVFTAAKDLTAAQVASAFANLAAGATHGNAPTSLGLYSGQLVATTGSGAITVTGTAQTVTFTSAKADGSAAISATGATVASVTTGIAHVDGEVGELAVVAGVVTIADSGDKTLAKVSVDGYETGSGVTSDALTSLSLANSMEDFTVTNAATNQTMTLTLDNIGDFDTPAGAAIDLGAAYTTLNIVTANNGSRAAIDAANATAIAVSGTKAVNLSGSTLSSLQTLTVTGAAGVTVNASGATVKSVNTTGTTGNSTVTIDATNATFTGGAGVDKVTLANTGSAKAVSLGAGNDSLTLASTTVSLTAVMSGGDGTDTLVMDAADVITASATNGFGNKIDSFEKLSVKQAGANGTIDLSNLDNINYVVSAGAAAGVTLTVDKMGANGTLELTSAKGDAASLIDVKLADATGTADVLNIVLNNAATAAVDFGKVKAAGVETVNITATDGDTDDIDTFTLDLTAAAAKSIVVTGNANVTLSAAASVALTSLDGSAMTGKLVAATNGTVAETIKGGSAADTLTANGNGDTLNGGAGKDTLIVHGNLAKLTGGAGADTFDISDATSNANSFATILDLGAGDIVKFADSAATETFKASKVVLDDSTSVFQDYANAAIAQTELGDITWFQIGGNTYVIENLSGTDAVVGATTSFLNGTDVIVKITGLVDLSHSAFNTDTASLVYIA